MHASFLTIVKGGHHALDYFCGSARIVDFRACKRLYIGRFYSHSSNYSRCSFADKNYTGQKGFITPVGNYTQNRPAWGKIPAGCFFM